MTNEEKLNILLGLCTSKHDKRIVLRAFELGKGVKDTNRTASPRYCTPKKWTIRNKTLYGLLMAFDIKLSELAKKLNVSERTVQRWVYEGAYPRNKIHREKLKEIF